MWRLLHNPRILFLDEPTIGLDAVAQKQMRGFLREVNRDKGTTILLTSHYMEDIRSLCSRCVVVSGGGKIYDGALDTLFQRYQKHKKITVSFETEHHAVLPDSAIVLEQGPYRISLLIERGAVQEVLKSLVEHEVIADIAVEEEDIGVVVERIYAAKEERNEKIPGDWQGVVQGATLLAF